MKRVKESQTRLNNCNWKLRSSLIYNTSARHERLECNTTPTVETRVQHEWDKSDMNATRVQHKCDTCATGMTRVGHEWKILILIITRVKTYFHTLSVTMWPVKDYKERNNFILRTTFRKCLVTMPKCV